MTFNGWLQIALFGVLVILIAKPLGGYMTRVFNGERTPLRLVLRPVELGIYKLCGVHEDEEQHWVSYAIAMLAFSFAGFVVLYAIQRLQNVLPFNPQDLSAVSPDLAFNTSVSFITNTNWQSYVPETTMSYLAQMAGLTVHNFVSAATGIVLAIALIRGFARRSARTLGNFWVDLTRCVLYLLLPIAIVVGLVFIAGHAAEPDRLYRGDHARRRQADHRAGPGGLAGSDQDAGHQRRRLLQRQLRASVREPDRADQPDPDPADLLDRRGADQRVRPHGRQPAPGLGDLRGDGRPVPGRRHHAATGRRPPAIRPSPHCTSTRRASALQAGGNMEGKEVRFGIANSALFTTITTDASCGAVNNMHDSLLPLAGMVPMVNIMLGEIIFGGVGSGLYGMLLFVIVAMFVAGLMVGRTPEYLGKKLEAKEVKMAMLAILILPLSILGFTALAVVLPVGTRRWPTPARTASPRRSTPTPRPPATTAAPSPASAPTCRSGTPRSASRCSSAAS